jgi:hypothetical protein
MLANMTQVSDVAPGPIVLGDGVRGGGDIVYFPEFLQKIISQVLT